MSCKWINGIFNPCKNFDGSVEVGFSGTVGDPEARKEFTYCKKCRVDIRKTPEPEQPIIKKSGGTWVMLKDGIDYFWPSPGHVNAPLSENICWEPILKTEITDDLAKFRPMVICGDILLQLYGVMNLSEYNFIAITKEGIPEKWNNIRLATVNDLKETK